MVEPVVYGTCILGSGQMSQLAPLRPRDITRWKVANVHSRETHMPDYRIGMSALPCPDRIAHDPLYSSMEDAKSLIGTPPPLRDWLEPVCYYLLLQATPFWVLLLPERGPAYHIGSAKYAPVYVMCLGYKVGALPAM